MRTFGAVVGLACGCLAAALARAGDAQFPYTAYANSDDVYIRSGPGKNYYPTDKLPRGEPVEIYRHDPGGWYAIRPPRGSFSWVPARLLTPTKDHLATVNGDRVVSRVGSRFSDVRDVIQVRLDRGEEVEVLETKSLTTGGQSELWCKITPPSGEFRWVFGKFVDDEPPAAGRSSSTERTSDVGSREPSTLDRPAKTVSAKPSRRYYNEDDPPEPAADGDPPVRLTSAARRDPRANRSDDDAGDNDVGLTAASDAPPERRLASTSKRTASQPDVPAPKPAANSFQAEIDAIDLALSAMVVEEPTVWKFDDLDRRAEKALDRAQTAVERGKARLLLDRIARFEDIKRRSDTIQQVQSATDRRNSQYTTLADARPPSGLAAVEPADRFDATGRLINVVQTRPNTPPYALVNADRVVVAFVSPAPGVNLRPYMGRQVGVSGQRGFIPEMAKPHITASRITGLDQPSAEFANGRDALRR